MKAEHGYVFCKDDKQLVIYQYHGDTTPLFEIKEKIAINGQYEVSLHSSDTDSLKATYNNIKQLLESNDFTQKEQKLNTLIQTSLNRSWTVIVEGVSIYKEIKLPGSKNKKEEIKNENGILEELKEEELSLQLSKSLINKRDLKNIEDFDMYESLIQGETLNYPSFLVNPCKEEDKDEYIFDVDFKKPLSLFWLKLELTFDARPTELKTMLPNKVKEECKSVKPKRGGKDMKCSPQKHKHTKNNKKVKNYEESEGSSKIEIDSDDNKWIPLVVHSHKGGAFNANSLISKLVTDDKRAFAANYAESHFIFSHQFGKWFIIDQFIVMSDNSSQIGAYPMGAGILFISDTLAGLQNTDPFHSFTFKEYLEWKNKRMFDPKPLQPYEPVGYFDFGSSVKIIDKIASKESWKYVKLVPTAFKKVKNNTFPKEKFDNYPIEFKFFGIIGEEIESKIESENWSESLNQKPVVEAISNTSSQYKIQIYNEQSESWNTIYEESSKVYIQEVQTLGMSVNIPASNLDKIITWISSNSITGIYKSNITNSQIQMNMIQKLRVIVSNSKVWNLIGLKLSPKALINNDRNSTGIFSNIPVKFLRSWILDPQYFNWINKEIVTALTDDEIDFNIRLRAIRTLDLIISLNPKMVPLIFKHLDLEKFIQLLYKQDSRGWRHILGLFRKFNEYEDLSHRISKSVISNISNMHAILMTYSSLEAFMNLMSYQMAKSKEKIFKITFETLYYNITQKAVSQLQTPEYTILRKLSNSHSYPFDRWNFMSHNENVNQQSLKEKDVDAFEKQGNPLPYQAKYISGEKVKEYIIEFPALALINDIRILFGETTNKAYRINLKIYGQSADKESLIFAQTYDESVYWYLTHNSHQKEYQLYDQNEEREALCINNLNYSGHRLKIHLNFFDSFPTLNSQHPIVEHIFPEIYGEFRKTDDERTKYSKIDGILPHTELKIAHSVPFTLSKIENKSYQILRCCPDDSISGVISKPINFQQNNNLNESIQNLCEAQSKLKTLIEKANRSGNKEKETSVLKINTLISTIESLKDKIPLEKVPWGDIVHSLEYQKWLATKFSQVLISLYKSNPESMKEILLEYPLEEVIYNLFVNYIVKDSQESSTKTNLQSNTCNEVWILINWVLLPSIKDQSLLNNLVIKIINNFILNSESLYSKSRVIKSLQHLPYSYDKIISYAIDNLNPEGNYF